MSLVSSILGIPPISLRHILTLHLSPLLDLPNIPKPVRIIPLRIARRNTEIKSQPVSSLSIWKVNLLQLQRERNRCHLFELRGLGRLGSAPKRQIGTTPYDTHRKTTWTASNLNSLYSSADWNALVPHIQITRRLKLISLLCPLLLFY